MAYSAVAPNEWGHEHVMAFIEMLSDASLLNLLIEMLRIEVLEEGNVPQSRLQESAEKSNLCTRARHASKCVHLFNSSHKSWWSCSAPSIYSTLNICIRASSCSSVPRNVACQNNIHLQAAVFMTKCYFAAPCHHKLHLGAESFGTLLISSGIRLRIEIH